MSQRSKSVDETMLVNLQVKVNLESFSNHDGFKEGQLERAIEEFKDEISNQLYYKLENTYYQQEFLQSVDIVQFEVVRN
jgi:peptide subunit release factor RF-3